MNLRIRKRFQTLLLKWYDQHGRKTLPWQIDPTPYHIWVSEIMLQQTQVSTVIPYYRRFIRQFPSIRRLAKAQEDEVLSVWSGLGYYARARNLHRAAQKVCSEYGGELPSNYDQLIALPGIGHSTAGAILSFAFQKRYPILDGNVKRVFTRVFGIEGWPGGPRIEKKLWKLADELTPFERVAHYNQAIMDIGALVCTSQTPSCHVCPWVTLCVAYKLGKVEQLPTPKPVTVKPVRQALFLMILRSRRWIFLEKQKGPGVWKGLWCFPRCNSQEEIFEKVSRHGIRVSSPQFWPTFRHTFTHFHLDITPVVLQASHVKSQKDFCSEETLWYNLMPQKNEQQIGLPAPVRRLTMSLKKFIYEPNHLLSQN